MFTYYTSIDLLSCSALLIMTLLVHENSRFDKVMKRKMYLTYTVIIAAILAEYVGIQLNEAPSWTIGIHKIVKCIDYILTPTAGYMVISHVSKKNKVQKYVRVVIIFNVILQIVSTFSEGTFYIDSNNIYHHGPLYNVYIIIYILIIIGVFVEFYLYGKEYKEQNRFSLFAIILIIFVAVLMQELFGFRVSYLGMVIGVILLFIHYSEFFQLEVDADLRLQKMLLETDALTELYSRYAYTDDLKQFENIDKLPDDLIVFSVDVNELKITNDNLGHLAGDELIKGAADCIKKVFGQYGKCYRTGGDEFIAFLYVKEEQAYDLKVILSRLAGKWKGKLSENLSLSVGYALAKENSNIKIEKLISIADKKMYEAKAKYYHNAKKDRRKGVVRNYEERFYDAIKKEEFVLWFQPKYNPYTNKIVGAEALVRWITADGNIISPGEFIPVFEENGLISQLDEYVFRLVCEHQKKWKDRGMKLIPISVNLSRNSMHQLDVAQRYKRIVEECGISPKLVPIEITESAAIDTIEIKPLADDFFEAGFPLHMDDFGSGKSSLTGLNVIHFEVVKLDKSLIDYIGDEHGELVLMYTIALGKELGLHLVAEGVETEEQLNYMRDIGCDAIQGYYYCKPLPLEYFEKEVADKIEVIDIEMNHIHKYTATDSVVKRAMDRMISRMPGGFLTYRCSEEEEILSSNSYLWKMFGCETEAEFMDYVGGSFKGVVCPEDLAHVETYIKKQIAGDINEMDYVEYNIIRKDGVRIPVVDYGHLDHQPDGDIYYVFISEAEK